MKTRFFFLPLLVMLLNSCASNPDSIIGTWQVCKVNVAFDESRSTPEIVRQIGEMERQNALVITPDSILTFNSPYESRQGRFRVSDDGALLLDGLVFGHVKGSRIVTKSKSPLGEIVVTYEKRR